MPSDHPTTRWSKFRNWSGVRIRGSEPFSPDDPPQEWDVVFQATTEPEGGAYNTFIDYDGTGITYGFAQWTATSGRLQRLLKFLDDYDLYEDSPMDQALEELGLDFDPEREAFTENGRVIRKKADIREWLTTPSGQVPKHGKFRQRADTIARGFWRTQGAEAARLQEEFFRDELAREALFLRPRMDKLTIAFYLYPEGEVPSFWTPIKDPHLTATRALFWSFWQNSPRKAEEYLHKYLDRLSWVAPEDLYRLALKFARSSFGFWGNRKCANLKDKDGKPRPRRSRYWKVARAINRLIGHMLREPLDPNAR
jgi:hypothetical protein